MLPACLFRAYSGESHASVALHLQHLPFITQGQELFPLPYMPLDVCSSRQLFTFSLQSLRGYHVCTPFTHFWSGPMFIEIFNAHVTSCERNDVLLNLPERCWLH